MKEIVIIVMAITAGVSQMSHTTTYIATNTPQVSTIDRLIECESSGNPLAYNKKDNDGLPKYGILQFRKETFYEQGVLYGILQKGMNVDDLVWDTALQKMIAQRMIDDGKVGRWGCAKVL